MCFDSFLKHVAKVKFQVSAGARRKRVKRLQCGVINELTQVQRLQRALQRGNNIYPYILALLINVQASIYVKFIWISEESLINLIITVQCSDVLRVTFI